MEKEEILEEIRRAAEKNGGIPLGRERFHKETNITSTDWYGKYWARWSDAVIEAGYKPNQMNTAYESEYLLEKYATLVAEIDRIPTAPELRIKAREDSDFPSHNTFSRFGSKKELLGHLLVFCNNRPEFSCLVEIIEKESLVMPSDKPQADESSYSKTGYVYLIQFGSEYKIGTSKNVERRFRELKTQMPYEGEIIHSIETGDPKGIEAYWHKFFTNKRLKGEWFKLSDADIKYFKKRKLM